MNPGAPGGRLRQSSILPYLVSGIDAAASQSVSTSDCRLEGGPRLSPPSPHPLPIPLDFLFPPGFHLVSQTRSVKTGWTPGWRTGGGAINALCDITKGHFCRIVHFRLHLAHCLWPSKKSRSSVDTNKVARGRQDLHLAGGHGHTPGWGCGLSPC